MADIDITRHAVHRTRERVGIPKKAVPRAVEKAMTEGLRYEDTEGGLRRYLEYLYAKGGGAANNMRVYGGHIYMFHDDILITTLTVPAKHMKQAARLAKRRRKDIESE